MKAAITARLVSFVLLALSCTDADVANAEGPFVVGSKSFTESVVLGELARLAAGIEGVDLAHRRELGGSRILFEALRHGEIDLYPEYTGALRYELLGHDPASPPDARALTAELAALGLAAAAPLGFDNSYALGMRRERAAALGITRISDLRRHPELKLGFSNEFMDRGDGWPGLARTYALEPEWVCGLDHDLAYRALQSGDLDVVDIYSTDADIAYYDLAVLEDDQGYFPEYRAVFLHRLDLVERAPGLLDALANLAGRVSAPDMITMNARVKLERQSETRAASEFLGLEVEGAESSFLQRLAKTTRDHLALVGISLAAAIVVAIPLGIAAAEVPRLGVAVLGTTSVLQTLPSLALFVFMIPLFGIGALPAVVALFLYSLLPIVRNTHAGLTGIAPSLRDSALALGLPRQRRLRAAGSHRNSPRRYRLDPRGRGAGGADGAAGAGPLRRPRALAGLGESSLNDARRCRVWFHPVLTTRIRITTRGAP